MILRKTGVHFSASCSSRIRRASLSALVEALAAGRANLRANPGRLFRRNASDPHAIDRGAVGFALNDAHLAAKRAEALLRAGQTGAGFGFI